jgi:hypothetical protein
MVGYWYAYENTEFITLIESTEIYVPRPEIWHPLPYIRALHLNYNSQSTQTRHDTFKV